MLWSMVVHGMYNLTKGGGYWAGSKPFIFNSGSLLTWFISYNLNVILNVMG